MNGWMEYQLAGTFSMTKVFCLADNFFPLLPVSLTVFLVLMKVRIFSPLLPVLLTVLPCLMKLMRCNVDKTFFLLVF